MFTYPVGFLGQGDSIPFLTYTHTWVGNADIQSNEADFDGAGDGVVFPDDAAFNLAGDDFTCEAIMNFDAFPQDFPIIFSKWGAAGDKVFQFLYRNDTNALRFAYSTNGTNLFGFDSSWTPTLGVEYHIAWCRDGSNLRLFIDGAQIGSTHNISTDVLHSDTQRQVIGNYDISTDTFATNGDLDGQINYLKVSDIALYTSNFTAPSTLENDADTIYLNSFEGANGTTPALNTQ